ncbi:MarR family transcriptional regulator [Flavobacterium sp. 90]|uniref:MarR family winged helix-turn-helix transcriptional regulator n=1 Tax=unclassified Flavobacterium TaxID=196869 RepID=UPI000EB52889|nr:MULTISPECIES: MarR family transcriptional regulator [unclassified Flavobacterium]RKR11820.1 MarR family transcriptional regulator [Flavobacterium sp. 81]TCK55595.1 MarR family transcriptional regulator [Flavobacterium sp. 90]
MSKAEDNTFSVEKPEESSGFLLWQVTNLWQREIKKALEEYNITHSQFVLMASIHWLTLHKQEVTQIILSAHTKIDPMTTSTVLRTLQQKSLITRQEHATDTRAKVVVLTDFGKEIIKKAIVTVEDFDRKFFSVMGVNTKDLNQNLISLLEQK